MITVSFSYENGVRELVCSGHAGYDPGNDVVCAAASAITGTLAAVLLKRAGEQGCSGDAEYGENASLPCVRGGAPKGRKGCGSRREPAGTGNAGPRNRAVGFMGSDNLSVIAACGDSSPYTGEPICLAVARREISARADAKYSLTRMRNVGLRRRDMFAFGERCAACVGDNPSVACGDSSPYTGEPICLAVARREISACADAKYSLTRMRNVGLRRRDMFASGERCAACVGDNPSVACGDSSPYTGEPGRAMLVLTAKTAELLAPSEEGAVEGGGTPSETEGEITPPAAATPHPSQLALQAETPSPQGEGLTDAQREVGGPSSPEAPRDDKGADTADMFNVSEGAGYCRITCAGDAAKPYFEFALVGLKKLAEAFPENVRVNGFSESEDSP